MDKPKMSASGQLTPGQFEKMMNKIKQDSTNTPIIDIDLCQESHGFINGDAVIWYVQNDW